MTLELSLRGVRAGYGSVEVLHGIDLDVPAGSITALLGANGAGKSTTLSVIAGLVSLRTGLIEWGGVALTDQSAHARAHAGMLLVPERRGIFPALTVAENLAIFGGSSDQTQPALAAFPVLAGRLQQPAGTLSGGEQQMLAMSHALLRQPRLLLLDEISRGLAPRVTRELLDVVRRIAAGGCTIVLVEQHLPQALELADLVYVLSRGRVGFAGEPAELPEVTFQSAL